MATGSIRVPDVGEGVAEVELVEWHVKPGDRVREDDVLAAVMTDKATVEIPSLWSGTVVSLGGELGQRLAVGTVLVTIEREGESDGEAADPAPVASVVAPVSPPVVPAADRVTRPAPVPPTPGGQAPLAAPSVRARAREAGVDLRQVRGSGPAGRILDADLDAHVAADRAATPLRREGTEDIRVIGLRRKIAERMAAAATIPQITLVEEVDVGALEDLRAAMNADRGARPKLTLLPFIAAALCRALPDHPQMNAQYDHAAGLITRHRAVHLGIATQTEAGLMVPVLRHAESLGLFATAAEILRLAEAARSGKATREELTGSTITVSSLGPLGGIATTPILNAPEVVIIGINKVAVRPVWDGSGFAPRRMMNLSASFDHRVIDGSDAAHFVQRVKTLLEMPALIFMEPEA